MAKINARTQAFLDLMSVQTQLSVSAEVGSTIPKERLLDMASKIGNATALLERTLSRAARIIEHGAEPD